MRSVLKEYRCRLHRAWMYLAFFTLPLYDYSWTSKVLIGWALYTFFVSHNPRSLWRQIRKYRQSVLMLSLPFWIALAGSFYGFPKDDLVGCLIRKLPFLLIPVLTAACPPRKQHVERAMEWFTAGILTASLTALAEAAYIRHVSGISYFYFDRFARLLNKHSTYFALFTVSALVYWLRKLLEEPRKKTYWLLTTYFLWILYLLSVRISLIALAVGITVLMISRFRTHKRMYIHVILMVSAIALLYKTPAFQRRFHAVFWEQSDGMHPRLKVMQTAWNYFREAPLTVGHGTAKTRKEWWKLYEKAGLRTAAVEHYNAHNQFLETLIHQGLAGLAAILWVLIWTFRRLRRNAPPWISAIWWVFVIFMTTESIWQRQNGIVWWSLIMSSAIFAYSNRQPCRGRKKLLLIGPYPPPAGGISVFMQNIRNFIRERFDADVKVLNELKLHKPSEGIFALGNRPEIFYPLRLIYYLLRFRPHIIYYNGPHGITRFLLSLYGHVTGTPVWLHLHGMSAVWFFEKNFLTRLMSRYTFRRAALMMAVNQKTCDFFRRRNLPVPRCVPAVVPAVGSRFASTRLKEFIRALPPERNNLLLSYGTLDKTPRGEYVYGIDKLLKFTVSDSGKALPYTYVLVIILKNKKQRALYHTEILPLIKAAGSRVRVFVHEGDEPLTPLYERTGGYIRWTVTDGFPLSVVEALQHGLNVYASNRISPVPEGVYVFDPEIPETLAELLRRFPPGIKKNHARMPRDFTDRFTELFGKFLRFRRPDSDDMNQNV